MKSYLDEDIIVDNEFLESIIKKYSTLKKNKKESLKWQGNKSKTVALPTKVVPVQKSKKVSNRDLMNKSKNRL